MSGGHDSTDGDAAQAPSTGTAGAAPGRSPPHYDELEALRRVGATWPARARFDEMDDVSPDLTVRQTRTGQHHGGQYVRVARRGRQDFRQLDHGVIQATGEVPRARNRLGNALLRVREALIGDPLSTQQAIHERLTKVKALAVLSSDALSSVAYATGAMTAVLILAGTQALGYSLGIAAAIVGLSYRQTIKAYPRGGGSYIVARDNLGDIAGLTAGSSLMIDYVLTVAVSISAGVAALVSLPPPIGPAIAPYTVPLDLAFVVLLLLGNLRGIRESGSIFMLPTYLFLLGIYVMLVVGAVEFFTEGAHVVPYHATLRATENLGLFLILRAFASGCTALTGVEAISDGVPAFKSPEWKNARTTLTVMAVLAIGMFMGITLLVHAFGLVPNPDDNPPTLLSKLAARVLGGGPAFIYIQVTTALILALAANTAYSDFPRLSYFMARDGFMPRLFALRGDRLAYSNGIILLTILATILIVAFKGSVGGLINLYVIGVFNSFTLSQASMVKRWWERRSPDHPEHTPAWRRNLLVNGVGALATFVVLVITAVTKFIHGAWLVVVLVPLMVALFWRIHRHYEQIRKQLQAETPLTPDSIRHTVLVPISDLNRPALQTLAYARSITDRVIAVHVSDNDEDRARIQAKWDAWGDHVALVIIDSPYRSLVPPLLSYIDAIDRQSPHDTLTVVLPEFVPAHWWDNVLHNQAALRLKAALLFRPGTVVTSVPYHPRRS